MNQKRQFWQGGLCRANQSKSTRSRTDPVARSYANRTGNPVKSTAMADCVDVDDFCKAKMHLMAKALHHCGAYKKLHPSQLSLSEPGHLSGDDYSGLLPLKPLQKL